MSSVDDFISQGVSGFNQLVSGASSAATQGVVQQAQGALPGFIAQASQAVQAEFPVVASAGGQAAAQAVQTSLPAVQQAIAPAVQQMAQQAGHDFGQGAVQGAREESVVPVAVVATGVALLALVVGVAAWRSRKPEVRAAEQPFYRDPNPTREQKLPFVGALGEIPLIVSGSDALDLAHSIHLDVDLGHRTAQEGRAEFRSRTAPELHAFWEPSAWNDGEFLEWWRKWSGYSEWRG